MQIKRKQSNNRNYCNTRRCGRIIGCVICLLLAACGFIVFEIQQQAKHKAEQEAIRIKLEEETVVKQQARLRAQKKRLEEEQERQRQEEDELARQKAAQEALAKQRQEALERERLMAILAKQKQQYQEWMEELKQAEQKMDSIAKLVDSEEAESMDWASEKLPKELDDNNGQEENEGQIEKVKLLVEEAEAKLKKLEAVMDP